MQKLHRPGPRATGEGSTARFTPRATPLRDKLGICQWFHFQDHDNLKRSLKLLHELKIKHLRTGISWADYYRPGGKDWYDYQMRQLRKSGLEILLSVWHTPPSISEGNACNSPPRRLRDYADFVDLMISDYGDCWHHLELWNEPNNRFKWDFQTFDPSWRKFAEMIVDAAHWAKQRNRHTVLGGMIPVDHHWLRLMRDAGALEFIDVVGIHAFPGMWFDNDPNWDWHRDWHGWDAKISYISHHTANRPIWVTETGFATWDSALSREAKYELQQKALIEAACAPVERIYWYSLIDLDPNRPAIEGFHVDENEYHMGLVKHDGYRKDAWSQLKSMLRGECDPRLAKIAEPAVAG